MYVDNYSHTNLDYDKKEIYKYFDNLVKGINIEYRTTTIQNKLTNEGIKKLIYTISFNG